MEIQGNNINDYRSTDFTPLNYPIYLEKCAEILYVDSLAWHEHIELLYYLSEGAIVTCGNSVYYPKKHDMIFINSNEPHAFAQLQPTPFYVCVINQSLFRHITNKDVTIQSLISGDKEIHRLFTEIFDEFLNKSEHWDIVVLGKMYTLIGYIFRNYKTKKQHTPTQHSIDSQKKISSILGYIHCNRQTNISVAEIAKKCNFTTSYFCKYFKKTMGVSCKTYINQLRVADSLPMLTATNESITSIAMSVGFDDINYFSRIFKKVNGMTPSEFRNQYTKTTKQ